MTGFSLLELLVSMFILALGLLGIETLEIQAANMAVTAYQHSLAQQAIANIRERIYFAPTDMTTQIMQWQMEIAELLPKGQGKVSGTYPNYQLQVCWFTKGLKTCTKQVSHY